MPKALKLNRANSTLVSINLTGLFVLFLIWPFLAMVMALNNYKNADSRRVVYFFLIFYGLTFIAATEGIDSYSYALQIKDIYTRPFSDFWNILFNLYSNETNVDFLQNLISFSISRFTDSHYVLFGAIASVYGYFYLKSINNLHNAFLANKNRNAWIHLLFFVSVAPIFFINGVRFYTATWMFFLGAYYVVLFNEKKYLILCFAAIFMHWSFISANVVLLIYFFIGNRNSIYIPLLIISFIVPDLLNAFFPTVAAYIGMGIQGRVDTYSNADYIKTRVEQMIQSKWFITWTNRLVLFYIYLAVIYIRYKFRSAVNIKEMNNLFSFMLLFLSFANFSGSLASGSRFQVVFMLFGIMYIFYFFTILKFFKVHKLTLIGFIPMILYTGLIFRQYSDTINAWIFLPSPFVLIAPEISLGKILFGL